MPFTVKLMRSPLAVEFEVGSIEEGLGILQDSKDKFRELLEFSSELGGGQDDAVTTTIAAAPGSDGAAGEAAPKRGRGKGKAAAEAVAPAPIPVPGAAPVASTAPGAAVATTTGDAGGIPDFLKRDAAPTAAAPPPPPLLPTAPPVAPPAATPAFILGNKIADDLQKRLDGSADKGAALQAWLMPHVTAITVPTATIDEVIAVIRFTADDKVAHLAAPLGIS